MDAFTKLVSRPQYEIITSSHEADNGAMHQTSTFQLLPDACRIAETDPSRLELAHRVLCAALNVLNHEIAEERRMEGDFMPPIGEAH